jgi:hypothetical protein
MTIVAGLGAILPPKVRADPTMGLVTVTVLGFVTLDMLSAQIPELLRALRAHPLLLPSRPKVDIDLNVQPDAYSKFKKDMDNIRKLVEKSLELIKVISQYVQKSKVSVKRIELSSSDRNSPVYYYRTGQYYVPGRFIYVRTFVDSRHIRWLEYSTWPRQTTSFVVIGYN